MSLSSNGAPMKRHEAGMQLGIQTDGASSDGIYALAMRIIDGWRLPSSARILDLGGGAGNFSERLLERFEHIDLFDYSPPAQSSKIKYASGDLNDPVPYADGTFDAVVALEVIEHLENPRSFTREIARILRQGGRCIITTPNQLSLASKLCFLLRDQFQHFQDSCYPAHITALLPMDLARIAKEVGLIVGGIHYTDRGRIPFTNAPWQVIPLLKGKWYSDNVAMSAMKAVSVSPSMEVSDETGLRRVERVSQKASE